MLPEEHEPDKPVQTSTVSTETPSPLHDTSPAQSPSSTAPQSIAVNPATSTSALESSSSRVHPSEVSPVHVTTNIKQQVQLYLGVATQPFGAAVPKVSFSTLDEAPALNPYSFPNQPKGRYTDPPATIANVKHMLAQYGVETAYDVIKKRLRNKLPGQGGVSDNVDNTAMTTILSLCTLNCMPTYPVPAIVEVLGDRNPYNPVMNWILNKPWDGIDRLTDLYKTVTVRDGYPVALKNILLYKWLLSAVAAALKSSGFKGRGVLVFQGPQGIGKTSWLMSLVPDPLLRDELIKVDHHLDANNKDSILGAICHWLVEIGELDSSFKKDFARLKGFLTSDSDKVRRPYARTESEYSRRTVFFATVNDENFLVDHTGNTRWWTIAVVAINYEHGIDMQQVFAQLAEDFIKGLQWWLTKEEESLLESCNSDHRTHSVIRDLLMELIDLDKKDAPGNPYKSTTELFAMLDITHPKNGDAKELTGVLRELLGDSKKVNGTQKWRIPLRKPEKDYPFMG